MENIARPKVSQLIVPFCASFFIGRFVARLIGRLLDASQIDIYAPLAGMNPNWIWIAVGLVSAIITSVVSSFVFELARKRSFSLMLAIKLMFANLVSTIPILLLSTNNLVPPQFILVGLLFVFICSFLVVWHHERATIT